MNLPTSSMLENPKPPRFFADALSHTTVQAYGEVATDGQGLQCVSLRDFFHTSLGLGLGIVVLIVASWQESVGINLPHPNHTSHIACQSPPNLGKWVG